MYSEPYRPGLPPLLPEPPKYCELCRAFHPPMAHLISEAWVPVLPSINNGLTDRSTNRSLYPLVRHSFLQLPISGDGRSWNRGLSQLSMGRLLRLGTLGTLGTPGGKHQGFWRWGYGFS